MPFLSPAATREALARMAQADDRSLRTIGFVCMLAGAGMLYFLK